MVRRARNSFMLRQKKNNRNKTKARQVAFISDIIDDRESLRTFMGLNRRWVSCLTLPTFADSDFTLWWTDFRVLFINFCIQNLKYTYFLSTEITTFALIILNKFC